MIKQVVAAKQTVPKYARDGEVFLNWDHAMIQKEARNSLASSSGVSYELVEDYSAAMRGVTRSAVALDKTQSDKLAGFPFYYASLLFSVFNRMEVIANTAPTDKETNAFSAGNKGASGAIFKKSRSN